MLRSIILLLVILYSSLATAYDINSYCEQVAASVGGSYQIEQSCRDMENEARNELSKMSIPSKIKNYCNDVGQSVGGSYQIFKSCIDMEIAAKSNLR